MKKFKLLWVVALCCIPVVYGLYCLDISGFFKKSEKGCPFCNSEKLSHQTFWIQDGIMGVYPYKPVVPGHVLIVPARHVERFEDLTKEELETIGAVIRRIQSEARKLFHETDYLLLQKNGRVAGQSVPHVHFHFIPRSRKIGPIRFIMRFFLVPLMKPISIEEIDERVAKWRDSILLELKSDRINGVA